MRRIKRGSSRVITLSLLVGLGGLALSIALWRPASVKAATFTVTSTADSGVGSLRQAISDALSGDTINFSLPAGSTINLTSGELLINKSLTINGPGANLLTVQRSTANGTPNFRIFEIASGNFNVSISGLAITNGKSNNGGGIYNLGTLTVTNSIIFGNEATDFGGIYNLGTLTVTNSTISGNHATRGGGIYNLGTLTVTNSTISGNFTSNQDITLCFGGGINSDQGSVTIANSTISGNSSTNGGGIINLGGAP